MIFTKSCLSVSDNSGVKYVKCLKVIRTVSAIGKKQIATIGDLILCSIKSTRPLEKIKKGDLFKALIIRTKAKENRRYGSLKFFRNSVIILDTKMEPIGNRVFGPVSRKAIEQNFVKLLSIKVIDF